MSIPKKKTDRLAWYETRLSIWQTNVASIGISADSIDTFSAALTVARAKLEARDSALATYRASVEDFDNAMANVSALGGGLVSQIRAKAKQSGDPNVYVLAQIPAPADPTPVGAPGTPEALKATLQPDGTLTLDWKCENPPRAKGTVYHVMRLNNETGDYKLLGGTGEKRFIDISVPAGQPAIQYRIRATRSTLVGQAADFLVKLGVSAAGEGVTSVTAMTSTAPKLAA